MTVWDSGQPGCVSVKVMYPFNAHKEVWGEPGVAYFQNDVMVAAQWHLNKYKNRKFLVGAKEI